MKLLLGILTIVLLISACNNASNSSSTSDSTHVNVDTHTTPAPASIDTGNLRRDTPNVDSALRK